MVIIYEPLCKGFSHEKINSGFIYSFSKAFPGEVIYFYAHKSHIKAIKSIIINDDLLIDNLFYKDLFVFRNITFLSYVINVYNLFRIRKKLKNHKQVKLFLTSYNTLILYIIKSFKCFNEIKFYLVLHGSFEEINTGELSIKSNQILEHQIPDKSILQRLNNISFNKILKYFFLLFSKNILKYSIFKVIFLKKFNSKKILEWGSNKNLTFIAISKHIIINAKKILDLDKINIKYHFYPNQFHNIYKMNCNKHVKFAIFGYGDPLILYNISKNLEKRYIQKDFEIRIIGMDNSITKYFSFIKSPSNGRTLKREEMEKMVNDIDFFLILYGNQKYRLSCSATILEAISYNKPIIHFKNDCISQFNSPNSRIGFESNSIDEFCDHLENCIINFDDLKPNLDIFYQNLNKLRLQYSIDSNFSNLTDIYI